MTVMRRPGGERRAIVECIGRLGLCKLELAVECIDLVPIGEHSLLLFRETQHRGELPNRA